MILPAASTLEWDAERPGLHTHAEHGHDQHTDCDRSSRSAWECLSGRSASALGYDVKRHGLDAHAKHHDQRARNQPKIFLKNTCMSDHELWSAALS